jgi:hypothetical protein
MGLSWLYQLVHERFGFLGDRAPEAALRIDLRIGLVEALVEPDARTEFAASQGGVEVETITR